LGLNRNCVGVEHFRRPKFIFGERTLLKTGVFLLSGLADLADQPVQLIGPWRHGGIAKQSVKFQFRNLVAFAGAVQQRLVIEDGDMAAPIADQPGSLQSPHDIGDRGSPDAEHHSKELVGEQKIA
jgi:hypothetical protein